MVVVVGVVLRLRWWPWIMKIMVGWSFGSVLGERMVVSGLAWKEELTEASPYALPQLLFVFSSLFLCLPCSPKRPRSFINFNKLSLSLLVLSSSLRPFKNPPHVTLWLRFLSTSLTPAQGSSYSHLTVTITAHLLSNRLESNPCNLTAISIYFIYFNIVK